MITDKYGRVSITEQEAFDLLYSGKVEELGSLFLDGNPTLYNSARQLNADSIPELHILESLDLDIPEFDKLNQANWFMPDEYKKFDIENYILSQAPDIIGTTRVEEELELFRQHNMIDVLRYIKYLVDTMRQHNIVWGVGRGSSVASYCLFLIGIHKINSIKYDLDIREFIKEK